MSSTAPTETTDQVFTEVDLQDDGILWMVNSAIFHPRGLALSRTGEGKLYLQGDGDEVWIFREDLAQGKKDAFDAMIARHLARF